MNDFLPKTERGVAKFFLISSIIIFCYAFLVNAVTNYNLSKNSTETNAVITRVDDRMQRTTESFKILTDTYASYDYDGNTYTDVLVGNNRYGEAGDDVTIFVNKDNPTNISIKSDTVITTTLGILYFLICAFCMISYFRILLKR